MNDVKKRIIVVLGSHRSGTSAIARGLKVLSVDLGEQLMEGIPGNNERGFWEDTEIYAFNKSLLEKLDSNWHSVSAIDSQGLLCTQWRLERKYGSELLQSKLRENKIFAFKDPRTAILLPIWQEIFTHLGLRASYLIVLRNPLDVASSLKKRDGFHQLKGLMLWAKHMMAAMCGTQGQQRVIVSYEATLYSPVEQLARISQALDLPQPEANSEALNEFTKDFLTISLRHYAAAPEQLSAKEHVPSFIHDLYQHLQQLSEDRLPANSKEVKQICEEFYERYQEFIPLLPHLDFVDQASEQLQKQQEAYQRELAELNENLKEAQQQHSVEQQNTQILNKQLDQASEQLQKQNAIAAELKRQLKEQTKKAEELKGAFSERDEQIADLRQSMAKRDEQIAGLNQAVAERNSVVNKMLASISWRLTRPLRAVKFLLQRNSNFTHKIRESVPKRFDATWYLKRNPDVAASGMRPFEHYMAYGKAEGRQPAPDPFLLRYMKKAQLIRAITFLTMRRIGGIRTTIRKGIGVLKREGLDRVKFRLANTNFQMLKYLLQRETSIADGYGVDFSASRITFDPQHGYCFATGPMEYTYIPPRRPDDLNQIIEAMGQRPTFSIVTPVYNTASDLLTKVLDSVTSQWYLLWELILVDDASTSAQTKAELARIYDQRVLVLTLPNNQGIAGATNAALSRATGEFIVLLDHDDELTEDCLFELAQCINRDAPDYIYSDEDKITPEGRFVEPHFKPDWSPDTLMSTMFVCHVSCIRRSLLEEIGGLRSEYDGCQDWDLVLRLAEKTNRISHIHKVLYHWRIIPASIAADIEAKAYVLNASRRVREAALKRRGLLGTVEPLEQFKSYFRVNYHPQGEPLISIIIPSRDNGEVLSHCLNSIIELSSYRNYELIVLDNGSTKLATLSYLEQIRLRPQTTVIRHDAPFNFSELNNIGVNASRGDILLFLNNDIEVISADWLERMAGFAQLPHVGAVGAKLLYPGGGQVQHAGVVNLEDGPGHAFLRKDADSPGYFLRNLLEYNWLAVTGACLMVERVKYQSVGGFAETFPIAYNDIELCFRLHKAGYFNVVCQAVRLIHHESLSRGVDHLSKEKHARLEKEKRRLFDTHPCYFQHDPFHNPNLHPNGINFETIG